MSRMATPCVYDFCACASFFWPYHFWRPSAPACICYHIQQIEAIPVDLYIYVEYVLTSATDSFNIHTSLVWLDPSLSLHMHVNGNYNGNYHVRLHAIQRVEREGSRYTRLHTHMSVHCGYRDTMSILYMCWYRIEI